MLSSNKDALATDRRSVELGSFSFTEQIIPSISAYFSIIRPNDQNNRGTFSVCIIRRSFGSNLFRLFCNFNAVRFSIYVRKNLSQKMFVTAGIDFHLNATFLRLV